MSDAAKQGRLVRFNARKAEWIKNDQLSEKAVQMLKGEVPFHLVRHEEWWYAFSTLRFGWKGVEAGEVFGRNTVDYPGLEERHCRFIFEQNKWCLEDLSSNGIWLNGTRITRSFLQPGDWILAAGLNLIWLDGSVCIEGLKGMAPTMAFLSEPTVSSFSFSEPEEVRRIVLEAPQLALPLAAESGGMGGMMAIGALGTLVSGWMVSRQDLQAAVQSASSSLLMAGAWIGWGKWRTRKSRILQARQQCQAREAYFASLQREGRTLDQLAAQRHCNFQAEWGWLNTPGDFLTRRKNDGQWQVPAGIEYVPLVKAELPAVGWNQPDLYQEMEEYARGMEMDQPVWQWLKPGGRYGISAFTSHQRHRLYYAWLRLGPSGSYRFVWIGYDPPVCLSEMSWLNRQKLCFRTFQEFMEVYHHSGKERWIICTNRYFEFNDPQSIILCGQRDLPEGWISLHPQAFDDRPLAAKWCRQIVQACDRSDSFQKEHDLFSREVYLSDGQANLKVCPAAGVFWDLHLDGPHALIAGATGSGKSEGLSQILLQLARQNHSWQLQLVLIDFKGGSFAQPFLPIPHLSGMITNLEPEGIERARLALEQELNRRQSIIAQAMVLHPDRPADSVHCTDPQTGKPFSDIVICVDEFGQLKSRVPEFLSSLIEMARIGRSLGIHLILSTQKPAGVVDEQIWSNTRSKLCFGVLEASDSREVLGHEKAAQLTHPGQFILQTGNGCEQQGQAWYWKSPNDGLGQIALQNEKGSWIFYERPSLQEAWSQEIVDRQESRRWLLCPDPAAQAETSSQIVMDKIQSCPAFSLDPGMALAIAGAKEELDQMVALLAACSKSPVMMTFDHSQSDGLVSWGDLAEQRWGGSSVLVIVKAKQKPPMMLLKHLKENPRVSLVVLFETIDYPQEAILSLLPDRIAFNLANKEQESLFFGQPRTDHPALHVASGMINHKPVRLACGQKPAVKPADRALPFIPRRLCCLRQEAMWEEADSWLGWSFPDYKPVMARTPFGIAWVQKGGHKLAMGMIERLSLRQPLWRITENPQEQPDVLLLDLSSATDQAQFLLEGRPFVFCGAGLRELQYTLGLNLPLETAGNAFWIEEGTVVDFQMIELLD